MVSVVEVGGGEGARCGGGEGTGTGGGRVAGRARVGRRAAVVGGHRRVLGGAPGMSRCVVVGSWGRKPWGGEEQDAWAWTRARSGGAALGFALVGSHSRLEMRAPGDSGRGQMRQAESGGMHPRSAQGRSVVGCGRGAGAGTDVGTYGLVVVDGVDGGWLMWRWSGCAVLSLSRVRCWCWAGRCRREEEERGGGRRKKFEERQMGRAGRGQGFMAHGPRAGYRAFLRPDPPGRRTASLRPQWAPPSPGPPRRPDPDPPSTRCRDTAPAIAHVRPRFCTWRVRTTEGCPHELEAAKLGAV